MKKRIFTLAIVTFMSVFSAMNLTAQDNKMSMEKKQMKSEMPDLSSWPEASRMAAKEMMEKYGNPDVMNPEVLAWFNKGQWKKIHVTKMESKHSFPVEHTDMLEQCISYMVPVEKMSQLGQFDGSITFDRTQGLMSARCDVEANNILALNLANDIVTGKKSVEEARKAYGEIVKEKMNGGNPAYMQKLSFSPESKMVGDPDINTTGLTKADVMKGMQKTGKNN